ncbi:NADPH-dependent 1-acyldihydroxyacetone phosphate reductase [Verticillium dahliae VdLs.17]|uniref:NADPH-dependent 1-acyldihydroxyacetone phosphate reductase n=1 Tax=Verticillium dahliae (strain VdLs.17 / ATCC MYA-4575 / FGSC 10137) TaxID=498257 RepID=G2X379_VERDV|nr:NADPH-dependent 1-acyldihydroxyacetone phosphate reductase [Verticillium dahliae VdLs.17]EGY23426.1 NADPH-dependent 1-acyldihydroxyacetone phosphate reductase [Verticillium dahliae VdLs.17]
MSANISQGCRTVLITGCTPGGIGYALVKEFNACGLQVIATGRRPEVLKALIGLGVSAVALDVTNAESIAARGVSHTIPATDIDLDEVRATFETNVLSVMAMVQAFVPLLIARRGLIINISSLSSVSPYVFGTVYSSTKGAINSYSRTLRQELRPFGVRVLVSMTGTVSTSNPKAHRELPIGSLYMPMKDLFTARQQWSQHNATMNNATFAKQLVSEALRGEGWLGGLLGGSRKWFWAGGLSTQVWLARWLFGETLLDEMAYRRFHLHELEAKIRKDAAQRIK